MYSNQRTCLRSLSSCPQVRTSRAQIDNASRESRNRSGSQRKRLALRHEPERDRVSGSGALAGRWGAIVEHVAEVGVAACAPDLDTRHPVAAIRDLLDVLGIERPKEARPSRCPTRTSRSTRTAQAAQPTRVDAVLLVVEEQPAERTLRALVEDHVLLLGREVAGQLGDALAGQRREIEPLRDVAWQRHTPKSSVRYPGRAPNHGASCTAIGRFAEAAPVPSAPARTEAPAVAMPSFVRAHP